MMGVKHALYSLPIVFNSFYVLSGRTREFLWPKRLLFACRRFWRSAPSETQVTHKLEGALQSIHCFTSLLTDTIIFLG